MVDEENFDNIPMFKTGKTLIIDGDIIVYRPCCIFNDDSDHDRHMIAQKVKANISRMMNEAGCDDYYIFLTTSVNFRDKLVDDYKANRSNVERPVNLKWAKRWATQELGAIVHVGLEADDLLGIYMTEDTVLWSLDKDLRQIPGKHLDDETRQVVTITEAGTLKDNGKKIYFDGMVGFYFQLLTGDNADYIVGCGKRVSKIRKSGVDKGKEYIARSGVGAKAAFKIIATAVAMKGNKTAMESCLASVVHEYVKMHGDRWKEHIETQGNLLWMVRENQGEVIKRWTVDGRDEYFDITTGVFYDAYPEED